MYVYSLGQWLLFFFLYCFLGWVWESCYVSAKRRQWVNRGFLHGPMLPIYGTGAVIILLATIPVRDSLWLVFLLGMLAATALEYVTGAAMEALFKVRYWDYSKQPFNLNGYICLTSSLAWGAFSILLVRFLHPPVEDLVLRLPAFLVDPLAFLLTIAVTVDAVRSFQAAMDLREVLTRLTEENEDLRRLAKRVEVISAFAEEDLRRFRERTEVERLLRQERWEDTLQQLRDAGIGGRLVLLVGVVPGSEFSQCGRQLFRRAGIFRREALHQLRDAVAHHVLELFHRKGGPAVLCTHPVACIGKVVDGVQQGAVQIK